MPKRKVDSEDEDIEQSEEEEVAPRPKKARKAPAKKRKAPSEDEQPAQKGKKAKKAADSDEEAVGHSTVDGVRFNTTGEESWVDIGNKKRITVRKFKSKQYVDIREFYEDKETGEKKPGKKGVSLAVDEWYEVRRVADAVDRLLSRE